uniref:Uncharacterized protein n=1 Tax=Fagus sylvatica TaxID=28930 RepID=A0A2N9ITS6_FAGSY
MAAKACHGQGMCCQGNMPWLPRLATAKAMPRLPWHATAKACAAKACAAKACQGQGQGKAAKASCQGQGNANRGQARPFYTLLGLENTIDETCNYGHPKPT